MPPKFCKDCAPDARPKRPAPYPGPRCATHSREHRKRQTRRTYEVRLMKIYGITVEEYNEIKRLQGGGCICYPWTGYNGASRALSVDHDHQTGYVRGALCKHCNDGLGRVRDDPRYFELMAEYLRNPPARQVVGLRIAPGAPRATPVVD